MTEPKTVDEPIKVTQNSLSPTAVTIVQYVLTALGGLLLTKGILPVDTDVNAIIGAVLIVGNAGYGAYKSWKHNEQKKVMEPYVPNSVAKKA